MKTQTDKTIRPILSSVTLGLNAYIIRPAKAASWVARTLLLSVAVVLLLPPQIVVAATFTVMNTNDSLSGSLRQAIISSGSGDTIVFSPSATGIIVLTNGELAISHSLTIVGPGPTNLSISGNLSSRVFNVMSSVTAFVSGLTIQNGLTNGAAGGLKNAGNLTLNNCIITGNSSGGSRSYGAGVGYGGGIYNQGTLALTNCVLTNNLANQPNSRSDSGSGYASGGGIYNGGVLTLDLCVISGNRCADGGLVSEGSWAVQGGSGGGIYNINSLTVSRCSIKNNLCGNGYASPELVPSAGGVGGGLYNSGTLTVSYSIISGNVCGDGGSGLLSNGRPGGNGGSGGGVWNGGVVSMTSCMVNSNRCGQGGEGGPWGSGATYPGGPGGDGGGIYSTSTLELTNCTFAGNLCGNGGKGGDGYRTNPSMAGANGGVGGSGGGIWSQGEFIAYSSTISGNTAGNGGLGGSGVTFPIPGVYTSNGGNGGNGGGGGGAYCSGSSTFYSCTIVSSGCGLGGQGGQGLLSGSNGLSGSGGGVDCAGSSAQILSTIIANNSAGGTGPDVAGSFTSLGFNLIGNPGGSSGFGGAGDLLGLNPQLGPLADNGGPTLTMALLPGSSAIDAGDDLVTTIIAIDQPGCPRLSGAHVDIGAYELCQLGLTAIGHISQGEIAYGVTVTNNRAYVVGSDGLHVYDVSNPANPASLGQTDTGSGPTGVAIASHYAVLANYGDGLSIYDVANPGNLVSVGNTNSGGKAQTVTVSGNDAYLANDVDGLRIYDISNPANPVGIGHTNDGGRAFVVKVSGNYAYLANNTDGLRIYNVSNPANPQGLGHANDGGAAWGVAVFGSHAYLGNSTDGLRIYDVSNPANPFSIGHVNDSPTAHGVAVAGNLNLVLLANGTDGLRVYYVADPANPVCVAHANDGGSANDVVVVGQYAYVANKEDGLRIYELTGVNSRLDIVRTNGMIWISISGWLGSTFQVQASTNLSDWQSIGTLTNLTGTMQFSDPAASNLSRRFYRLLTP